MGQAADEFYRVCLRVTITEQCESSWRCILKYYIFKSMMVKSIVLAFKCTWKPSLPSEAPGNKSELVQSMSYSQSISKEVHQLCIPLWEQLRKWIVCCSMRSKWPNEIMHLHKALNYVWRLRCSLGSIPTVRNTGRPKSKRAGKHIQWLRSHELVACIKCNRTDYPDVRVSPAHGQATICQGMFTPSGHV